MKWFEIHADQRLRMMNFFIVICGFSIAVYFTALEANSNIACSIIAALLSFISFCFKRLDERTSQLVKIGENHLKVSLRKISKQIDDETVDIVNLAEESGDKWTYTKTFNIIFCTFALLGITGAAYPWIVNCMSAQTQP